jgi:hypothetical protein
MLTKDNGCFLLHDDFNIKSSKFHQLNVIYMSFCIARDKQHISPWIYFGSTVSDVHHRMSARYSAMRSVYKAVDSQSHMKRTQLDGLAAFMLKYGIKGWITIPVMHLPKREGESGRDWSTRAFLFLSTSVLFEQTASYQAPLDSTHMVYPGILVMLALRRIPSSDALSSVAL